MKKKITYTIYTATMMLASFVSLPASASSSATKNVRSGYKASGGTNQDKLTGNGGVIEVVVNTMLFIAGLLAVIIIIYSGIKYMTANGDKQKIESAKSTLMYAIVGLIITIIAYAIVNFVIGAFQK